MTLRSKTFLKNGSFLIQRAICQNIRRNYINSNLKLCLLPQPLFRFCSIVSFEKFTNTHTKIKSGNLTLVFRGKLIICLLLVALFVAYGLLSSCFIHMWIPVPLAFRLSLDCPWGRKLT